MRIFAALTIRISFIESSGKVTAAKKPRMGNPDPAPDVKSQTLQIQRPARVAVLVFCAAEAILDQCYLRVVKMGEVTLLGLISTFNEHYYHRVSLPYFQKLGLSI